MCEKLLTNSIHLAAKSGNEYGWYLSDLEQVRNEAIFNGLACLGGQVQFCGKWGTAEAYWLSSDPSPQKSDESIDGYVKRSWDDFMKDVFSIQTNQYTDAAKSFKCLEGVACDWDIEAIWIIYFSNTAAEQGDSERAPLR